MVNLDIVVFGATGFTGKLVVDKLFSLNTDVSWGVAGRSEEKLKEMVKQLGHADSKKVPIIVADVADEVSLRSMVRQARVIINCTGPYTTLGEPVVKACVESGTHYVDMSAELHFIFQMYEKYNIAAEAAGVLIVTACGFGSVPAAMGMVHLEKQFQGILNSVECYTALDLPRRVLFPGFSNNTLVHYGTWASLVHELQNFREYNARKQAVFSDEIYEPPTENSKKSFLHRHSGRFWFPYPGPDHDAVDMAERYLKEKRGKRPVRLNIYTTVPCIVHLLVLPVFFFYYYASYFRCFRRLLWRFPKFFTLGYMSHKGPSQKNREETKFSFLFTGRGVEKNKTGIEEERTLSVMVSGNDPYSTTALTFVMSALTVVKQHSLMPKGGVLTPGAAFYETDLLEQLHDNGLKFEILKN